MAAAAAAAAIAADAHLHSSVICACYDTFACAVKDQCIHWESVAPKRGMMAPTCTQQPQRQPRGAEGRPRQSAAFHEQPRQWHAAWRGTRPSSACQPPRRPCLTYCSQ
jgi:hypothetical protein